MGLPGRGFVCLSPVDRRRLLCVSFLLFHRAREAGPVHAGHQLWRQLGIEAILQGAGISERARWLTEATTLNRLISAVSKPGPTASEYIERELAEREKTLFNLDDTVYLYDMTSTYFEGQAKANSQAKRGYSRDRCPDCKQVVVGLCWIAMDFPKRMRSSTAISKIDPVSRRCWTRWKNEWARNRARR